MGFLKFSLIAIVFFGTFPFSLLITYLVFGGDVTLQLLRALLADFLITLFCVSVFLMFSIWLTYQYLWSLIVDWIENMFPVF